MRAKIDPEGEYFDPYMLQFEKTATEAAREGHYLAAGQQLIQQVAQAVPSVVLTSTGVGGMLTLGTSAAGSSYTETLEKAPDSSLGSIYVTSLVKGGFEFASEYVTRGILKKGGLLFSQGGKPAINAYSKGVVKEVFKDFVSEGTSEASASLAGHILDNLVHGIAPPENLWAQLTDEFLVGGLLGGGTSFVGSQRQLPPGVINTRLEQTGKIEADKADAAEIDELVGVLRNAKTEDEKKLAQDSINAITTRIETRNKQHVSVVEDMTLNEAEAILAQKGLAEKYEDQVKNNTELTDSQKDILSTQATAHRAEAQRLYDKVANYPAAVQEAAAKKADIARKREENTQKEKALATAPNPNPVSTQKLAQDKADLDAQEQQINNALNEFRPDIGVEGLLDQLDKQQKTNDGVHKDNIKVLESRNATQEEKSEEIARYEARKQELDQVRGDLDTALEQRGEAREASRTALEETLAGPQVSEQQSDEASAVIGEQVGVTPRARKKIIAEAVNLVEKPTNKPTAARLAKSLKTTAKGIGTYLSTNLTPATAKHAIDNIITEIQARENLTDAEKNERVAELRKEMPKQVPLQSNPDEQSYLDDSDIQYIDDAQFQADVQEALDGGFKEATEGVSERKDLTNKEEDKKQEDRDEEAAKTFMTFVARTTGPGLLMVLGGLHTQVLLQILNRLPLLVCTKIIAESLVGNKKENFTFDNAPSSSVLTRVGRNAYEYLKAAGKDVSYFEKISPRIEAGLRAVENPDGTPLTDEEIKQRAISYRSLEAGGDLMRLAGGPEGFFIYDRGFPKNRA